MTDVLHLLQHRRSTKKFGDIAPNAEQLENMIQAALRAPDNGTLKPYKFIVIEKTGMNHLKDCMLSAVDEFEMGEAGEAKAKKISSNAPMMIGVVANFKNEKPIPEWEQMLTAGCATYAMQLAANAQGFETCWITNKWVNAKAIRSMFQCGANDMVIALVMIGSPAEGEEITLARQPEDTTGFVTYIK